VSEGNYIPLQGQGNVGRRGGRGGDVFVFIAEEEHPHFHREGDDVLLDLTISVVDAVLGTDVEVPTLSGRARLHITPGTQPGTTLRMRDKGIPHVNSHGKGDQLVRVQVHVPGKLTAREKELLKELSTLPNFATKEPKATKK
jgi:molecular chaperone DnaJ